MSTIQRLGNENPVATLDGRRYALTLDDLNELRGRIGGAVLLAGDEG